MKLSDIIQEDLRAWFGKGKKGGAGGGVEDPASRRKRNEV